MSALSDPSSVELTRDPTRDGDVRDEAWWQELTGLTRATAAPPAPTSPPASDDAAE